MIHVRSARGDRVDRETLHDLFRSCLWLPWRQYGELPRDLVAALEVDAWCRDAERSGRAVVLESSGEILAAALVVVREWDTRHFGFTSVDIRHVRRRPAVTRDQLVRFFRRCRAAAEEEGGRYLFASIDAQDHELVAAMHATGLPLAHASVEYGYDLIAAPVPERTFPCEVRLGGPEDLPLLEDVAAHFGEGRFFNDPGFPREQVEQMYRMRLRSSLGVEGAGVLVAVVDDRAAGFTTFDRNIGLNRATGLRLGTLLYSAVAPSARRRHAYTAMIHAGLRLFQAEGMAHVNLGTLLPILAVQRTWSALGFRIDAAQYDFAGWIGSHP